jgi:DNA-binding NtrC family response regulator
MLPDLEPDSETFKDPQSSAAPQAVPVRPQLFVIMECDRPLAGGARHSLTGVDEVVIGRGTERIAIRETVDGISRLSLRIPSRSMSGLHARLLHRPEGWVLEDSHSTNGSFVNGRRVERAVLHDDDIIHVGRALLSVRLAVREPKRTATDFDSATTPPPAPGCATLLPVLAREFEMIGQIAPSNVPVLLLGDTGTGKEVLARAVHALSNRTGAFIGVNCGALPPNLVESHLFGHIKGSFSGAVRDEPGFVRSAQDGTLLLDEIGDLPRTAQAALLRVLQEKEVVPVGGSRPHEVDVRVVAATHRDLEELVDRGDFRRDLWARLNGLVYRLPQFRDRREDLGVIMTGILRRAGAPSDLRIGPEAGMALIRYDWPLNIRELEQCLLRGMALTDSKSIELEHLPPAVAHARAKAPAQKKPARAPAAEPKLSEKDLELRKRLLEELEKHQGNLTEVARAMGKARMQVHRWMNKLGIEADRFRK